MALEITKPYFLKERWGFFWPYWETRENKRGVRRK